MTQVDSPPVFSVIIPTHNRAQLLMRAVRSVLAQTFSDFEVIIVDDASTDETAQRVKQLTDPRLSYLRRDRRGSAAASRNTGIQQARGELIALLDDDDEVLPRFLEQTYRHLKPASPQIGFSWCGIRRIIDTPTGEEIERDELWQPVFSSREQAHLSFLRSRRIGTNCGVCLRQVCFDTVGLFDETMAKAEDTDFFIRLVRHFDFVVIPEVLVKIHLHPGPRLTQYDRQMAAAYERIIEKNLVTLRDHPALWTALHYKAGWLYYHGGHKRRGRTYIKRALQRTPFHLKTWLGAIMLELLGRAAPRVHQKISLWKKQLPGRLSQKRESPLPN